MPVRPLQGPSSFALAGSGGPVDAASVTAGLGRVAPFDVTKSYKGGVNVSEDWKTKDAAGLKVWENVGAMGPTFKWAAEMNMGDGGDYLGRALSQNADASIWLQALVKEGIVKEPKAEWRAAIEVASMTLDVGNDGAGRTGYSYVLTGVDGYPSKNPAASVKMPAGLHARAAMLVGGSGGGGFHVEKAYDGADQTAQFSKRLVREANVSSLLPRAVDRAHVEKEIGLVDSGALVKTKEDREAFADALLIVKLADRSRGSALSAYRQAGGGAAGLEAMKKHRDWGTVVSNYVKHKDARKD
jgi:hypothetical protein